MSEEKEANAPLFATQGGGVATLQGETYVWHSDIPDYMAPAKAGDPIPEEWSVVPINETARNLEWEDADL